MTLARSSMLGPSPAAPSRPPPSGTSGGTGDRPSSPFLTGFGPNQSPHIRLPVYYSTVSTTWSSMLGPSPAGAPRPPPSRNAAETGDPSCSSMSGVVSNQSSLVSFPRTYSTVSKTSSSMLGTFPASAPRPPPSGAAAGTGDPSSSSLSGFVANQSFPVTCSTVSTTLSSMLEPSPATASRPSSSFLSAFVANQSFHVTDSNVSTTLSGASTDDASRPSPSGTAGNPPSSLLPESHSNISTTLSGSSTDDESRPPPSVTATETSNPSSLVANLSFHFYSGNPKTELTRGVVNLYRQKKDSTDLPVGRKAMICALGMPNHMKYADFCLFSRCFHQHILEMRTVRLKGMEDRYSVLIKFDNQETADQFFDRLDKRYFSPFKGDIFHLLFTVDVQYTHPNEHVQAFAASSTEQASCAVCLEELDQDTSGIFTTVCNHSFHLSCISEWTDAHCPVCQYCHQQPEKSRCFVCQTSDNVWVCIVCGFHGCGRFNGHAIAHWKETQHNYSLELETQRVWDYAGDNYVRRLFESRSDGQLWRLNPYCVQANDSYGSSDSKDDEPRVSKTLLNSKVEVTANEFNELLTTRLQKQKLYFESLLQDAKEETQREISEAVEKAIDLKLHKSQAEVDKCAREKAYFDDPNEHLLENQEILKAKIIEIEERQMKALQVKDEKIRDLEEQLRDLMACLEARQAVKDSDAEALEPYYSTDSDPEGNCSDKDDELSLKDLL